MDLKASFLPGGSSNPIPHLLCRGTHFEVGLKIGSHFKELIHHLLQTSTYYTDVVLKAGHTPEGQLITQECLHLCKEKYPEYINELEGMAKGAEIEFEKLFMVNIDSILETLEKKKPKEVSQIGGTGCTTILCNNEEVLLGHTEDVLAEMKGHVYIVSAEIMGNDEMGNDKVLEKFTTLCYAGSLMGFTMGYNSHGMIYSVNTLFPEVYTNGTPRSFIARAVLGSKDVEDLVKLLKDKGNGISDGFSLNAYFYPKDEADKGKLYNVEVSPPESPSDNESVVDILEVKREETYFHCNKYLRLQPKEYKEDAIVSSDKRMSTVYEKHDPISSERDVELVLSDQSDFHYPIFNDGRNDAEYEMNFIRTAAVGIFNINQKTWSVYSSPPTTGNPDHTFNL